MGLHFFPDSTESVNFVDRIILQRRICSHAQLLKSHDDLEELPHIKENEKRWCELRSICIDHIKRLTLMHELIKDRVYPRIFWCYSSAGKWRVKDRENLGFAGVVQW